MSIRIGNYEFDGPYSSLENLEDRSGIYSILCQRNGEYNLIDVGESATVKTRVANHERNICWRRNCQSTPVVAVYYTPNLQQQGRMAIEQKIRGYYNGIPCGER